MGSVSAFSQHFTYKRILSKGYFLKTKGTMHVTDTLITITGKGYNTAMSVKVDTKAAGITIYKVKESENKYSDNMRLSFSKNQLSKKEEHLFVMESKDPFSGTLTTVTYYLKPE